jgi:hypothetical protein
VLHRLEAGATKKKGDPLPPLCCFGFAFDFTEN